ncbi:hypothetical protein NG895_15185 [Aeoliella sp. ICT_H6.2]|uniref:Uncharacterized protein n=1 Tax=Aeoliella straminimaris TaxID=2954799 RepID=A0A9X2JJQ0_9BACT|nr:hypothetical protein [Aeoliella straminimaris]MCO6045254.1 hypothetical protein [Aeoliella straminimaris]
MCKIPTSGEGETVERSSLRWSATNDDGSPRSYRRQTVGDMATNAEMPSEVASYSTLWRA